ncbi:hypothetical protein RYD26_12135 [Pasteurellaceae bacterium LIM206]|nr:hypothetical protein [Pasteurellaceae bacterium LIM206]
MKSTKPLKSTGKVKYYDNGWNGNQYAKTTNVLNKTAMKRLAKGAWGVGTVLDIKEVVDGYEADGKTFGKNTTEELAGVVGGTVGASGGAYIGGVAGAVLGSWAGEETAEWGTSEILGKE